MKRPPRGPVEHPEACNLNCPARYGDVCYGPVGCRAASLRYGDPGPPVDRETFPCTECWHDRQIWLGNTWGLRHTGRGLSHCQHECHLEEVWLA